MTLTLFICRHAVGTTAALFLLQSALLSLLCLTPVFAQNDFRADTVTIVQGMDQDDGQQQITHTMTTEEFVHAWNLGEPLRFTGASTDAWAAIVPTPEPPVDTADYQNGDQVVFFRSGTFEQFRYKRTTTYEYVGGPGGVGSQDDPWAIPSNTISRHKCGDCK